MIQEIAKEYFSHFSDKNIEGIGNLLSNDCMLIDWDVEIITKFLILENNHKFFKEVNFLLVEIKSIHQIGNKVFCDILIKIDNISLEVIDILTFNEKNLIKKIHAYRSREILN